MNDNNDNRILINTTKLIWNETDIKGIYKKVLSKKDEEETSLIKIEKDTKLNTLSKINSVEIFVIEGTYINEYGDFNQGTYLQFSKEDESLVTTDTGCTVFRKINYFDMKEQIIINTKNEIWHQGHGNLEVMPLYEQTALVKWPKGERFIPHKHWGGEEIFVLSGTFIDEHGIYPKGTWIRSPHLSEHFPYVEEETIIYVKTGHL